MKSFFFCYDNDTRVIYRFQNCLKDWIFNIFKIEIKVLILWNFKVLTTFEKKLFITSSVLDSLLIDSSFSLR